MVEWLVGCWLEEKNGRTEGGNKDQIDDLYLLEATMYLNRHLYLPDDDESMIRSHCSKNGRAEEVDTY